MATHGKLTEKLSGRVSVETVQQFQHYADRHGFTGDGKVDAALVALLDPITRPQEHGEISLSALLKTLYCDAEETERIEAVVEKTAIPWDVFVKDAILKRVITLEKRSVALAHVDLSDRTSRTKVKGASYQAIDEMISRLMRENEAATEIRQRRYISKPLLQRLCGVAPITTAAYWDDHKSAIDTHNYAMGFTSAEIGRHHNQWIYGKSDKSEDVHEKLA